MESHISHMFENVLQWGQFTPPTYEVLKKLESSL